MTSPKITFVVAARNDDYGGNFLHRMQVFVTSLVALAREENLSGELVIVEWNPPASEPSLHVALAWSSLPGHFAIRFIQVPKEIHLRYENTDRMPMFEYIAKNVGIRRAAGDFVVATNPDLIFSRELIRFFASQALDADCFYRVDRHDVSEVVPADLPVGRQLAFCRRHTFLINTAAGSLPRPHRSLSGFFLGLRRFLNRTRGLAANAVRGRPNTSGPRLHTNAAGDFFLMSRKLWHELRGYPELTTQSYIDGYICFMAASKGLKQRVLKGRRRVYHQDHDRTDHSTRPRTDYDAYLKRCHAMLAAGEPEISNPADWGIADFELTEYEVHT
jgi:hypothetical protein